MLSIVFSATTIAMNRGEQESLFRQSHNIRLQQDAKAQCDRIRHYSYGNIHQISNLQSQASNSRSFGEDQRPFGVSHHHHQQHHTDDLVLSVLKTPLKETSFGAPPIPSPIQSCVYTALQGSEDELVDDIESAKETTELECYSEHHHHTSPSRPFQFLRRFRPGRGTRFEAHHRRVPTPMRRKSRGRSKSQADILDGVSTGRGMDIILYFDNIFIYLNILCV